MKVLIAYDGSDCANAALDDLRRAGLPEKTQIIVLSVIEHWLPLPPSLEVLDDLESREEYLMLARRAAAYLHSFNPSWETRAEVGFGSPAGLIIKKADEWRPDLIVVGSHGRTAPGRFFYGSVSQTVLHEAHGSVRIARGRIEERGTPIRIIIAVDSSSEAEAAVRTVSARIWPKESEVRIVTALWSLPPIASDHLVGPAFDWVAEEKARLGAVVDQAVKRLKSAGLKTNAVKEEDNPKRLIINEAENWGADCIFVGARGAGIVGRFLMGSVSSAVAARAHCSVEVVREPIGTT
jgi:nucleotide-binding universal stress UspA family protein